MKIFNLILLGLLLIMVLLPYNTGRENAVTLSGTLLITEFGENKDISLDIAEDENWYFINRGLEKQVDSTDFSFLKGQKISIMYAKHWTHYFGYKGRHITELKRGERIIYSELPH